MHCCVKYRCSCLTYDGGLSVGLGEREKEGRRKGDERREREREQSLAPLARPTLCTGICWRGVGVWGGGAQSGHCAVRNPQHTHSPSLSPLFLHY